MAATNVYFCTITLQVKEELGRDGRTASVANFLVWWVVRGHVGRLTPVTQANRRTGYFLFRMPPSLNTTTTTTAMLKRYDAQYRRNRTVLSRGVGVSHFERVVLGVGF